MTFNGFISYSHAADGRLAPAVQRGLHRLAKPWHRRRALWIFRDQTGLAVTPGLWSSIQTALDGSEYFVLMASPEAARSPWVNREIEHWIATKPADRVLPVVTDGEWVWDAARGDFTEDSTAVPPALRGMFTEEPFFLDLRWARGSEHLSLHHSRFRDAIAQLAAPMHGVSKDELEGEDVRQHRKARRLRSGAAASLVVLALLAAGTGMSAVRNAERARSAAAEALRQEQLAGSQRDNAEQSAAEARRQQDLAQQQRTRATRASADAAKSERAAREQQRRADQAAAEAHRQRALAAGATNRTREQQQLAKVASERAQRLEKEAQRLEKESQRLAEQAAEQRRLAREAAAEADRQQAKADQQQRVAVSRRLMNQAALSIVDDPETALKLGAAAQKLNPDATTRQQLAGVVTATDYAGAINDVTTAVYGSNGTLATLGRDNRVSLWKVTDPLRPARIGSLPDPALAGGALVFSPDARTLAVVNAQRRVVLWDIAQPSRPVPLVTVPDIDDVNAMTFSGNGKTFVTGDADGNVNIWDTADRARPVLVFTENEYFEVTRLAISPNGRLLLAQAGRFMPFWDITDRAHPITLHYLFNIESEPFTFSPDGTVLAVGGHNGDTSLWDMTDRTVTDGSAPVTPVTPVPFPTPKPPPSTDNPVPPRPPAMLAPAAVTRSPNPTTTKSPPPPLPDIDDEDYPVDVLNGLTGVPNAMAFSADSALVAAGDSTGTVRVWDRRRTASPGTFTTMRAHGPITALSFDPAGKVLVTTDGTGTATMWTVTPPGAPEALATLTAPDRTSLTTAFSPDGRSLVAAGSNGTAATWDTTDPARPARGADLALRATAVRVAAFSPDHRTVATAAFDGTLTVADPARPAVRTNLPASADEASATSSLVFSPDGRTLAAAADGTLLLWNVSDRARPVLVGRLGGAGISGTLVFTRDGRTLVSSGSAAVTLWNVADRSAPVRLAALSGQREGTSAVAVSPDGRTLATGGFDQTATLWDITERVRPRRLATLTGHRAGVSAVTFGPDGRTLAVAAPDYSVILWDTAYPAVPVQLATVRTTVRSQVAGMTFRRDGRTLAVTEQSSGRTPTVTLWSAGKLAGLRADPARYACAIAGSGLTAGEWARFVPEIGYRRTCPK